MRSVKEIREEMSRAEKNYQAAAGKYKRWRSK